MQVGQTMSIIQRPITYQQRSSSGAGRFAPEHQLRPSRIISRNTFFRQPEFHPDTSIVVPVMNESDNVLPLIARISDAVEGRRVEVIFVDDSRDTLTIEAVALAQAKYKTDMFDVRILHREGEDRWGGLSGAVTDGVREARANQILVMDGDLQHPPETIPAMIDAAKDRDVVVASRYCPGGSASGLDGGIRHLVSRGSTILAKVFFPRRLKSVSDPMTGFFLFDKRKIERSRLRPKGFKILLEMLATHPELTRTEVPLQFAERTAGESHGSLKQGIEFFVQLLDLRFGVLARKFRKLPKFVQFGSIGGSVFVLGMAMLYGMVELLDIPPLVANAVQLTVTFWLNYVLNRHITWRERNISRRAAYKFLVSRATTTVINYFLFAALISLQFAFTVAGYSVAFSVHYLTANVITLIAVMALNYEISDRWAFAEPKPKRPRRLRRIAANGERNYGMPIATSLTILMLAGVGVTLFWAPANVFLPALLAASSLALFLQSSIEVWRMMYSYREPGTVDNLRFPEPLKTGPVEKFCLIVPARHESDVLAHTLTLLAKQTHTSVDIISVVCDDDYDTLDAARAAAENQPRIQVIAYPLAPDTKPSKPLQLNYVFEQTAGRDYTVFGVVDAEDTVHPELLTHIEAAFQDPKIDVVQGGVQLMNHDSSWYSLHNVLEYYRWFNSAMSYNADRQFMPLGGNTIFIRAGLLRKAGGWPLTLTEDCSLGVLLSTRFNARTAVYYDPRLATREETPSSLTGLFRQRVRWNQGFFHEWRTGIWLELPTFRQRLLAGYVLLGPLLLALINIFMAISLLAIFFLKAPVGLAMMMYLPLIPAGLLAILNGLFLHDFGKAFNRPVRLRHYFVLFATQAFYQVVLNTAALWSVVRELRGDSSWYKTPHSGLHRGDDGNSFEELQPAYAMASIPATPPPFMMHESTPIVEASATVYHPEESGDRRA